MRTQPFHIPRNNHATYSDTAGFTLIELMVTIAIVAILTTVALPAMRDYVLNQRIKTASFDLMSTLLYARSEAVKRNHYVLVIPTTVSGTAAWHNGWSVYDVGASFGACSTPGVTSLRTHDPMPNFNIPANISNPYCYGKDGHMNSAGAVSVITVNVSPSQSNIKPRCISVGLSGLPITTLSTTGTCP